MVGFIGQQIESTNDVHKDGHLSTKSAAMQPKKNCIKHFKNISFLEMNQIVQSLRQVSCINLIKVRDVTRFDQFIKCNCLFIQFVLKKSIIDISTLPVCRMLAMTGSSINIYLGQLMGSLNKIAKTTKKSVDVKIFSQDLSVI